MPSFTLPRSERQEFNQPDPFLGLAGGPDEDETVEDGSNRARLVDKQQSANRLTGSEQRMGRGGHGVHVMRDDDPALAGGESEHVQVGQSLQTEI